MTSQDLQQLIQASSNNLAGDKPGTIVGDIFTKYFLPAAGLVMFIYLIMGGYEVMLSAGNPKSLASGKGKITNALIGFVIIFTAYWIVQGVAIAFGLKTFDQIF